MKHVTDIVPDEHESLISEKTLSLFSAKAIRESRENLKTVNVTPFVVISEISNTVDAQSCSTYLLRLTSFMGSAVHREYSSVSETSAARSRSGLVWLGRHRIAARIWHSVCDCKYSSRHVAQRLLPRSGGSESDCVAEEISNTVDTRVTTHNDCCHAQAAASPTV